MEQQKCLSDYAGMPTRLNLDVSSLRNAKPPGRGEHFHSYDVVIIQPFANATLNADISMWDTDPYFHRQLVNQK